MNISLHSSAIENFNKRAEELLLEIRPRPEFFSDTLNSFDSGSIAPELKLDDIVNKVSLGEVNNVGISVAKYFLFNGKPYGLYNNNFKEFVRLCENIQRVKELSLKVSKEFILNTIFSWMFERFRGQIKDEMIKFLLEEVNKNVKKVEVWIPIAWTKIETQIRIGNITIKNFSKEDFDNLSDKSAIGKSEVHKKQLTEIIEMERKKKQGQAVAVYEIEAEENRASELAFENVNQALSILSFFSEAMFYIDFINFTTPLGMEKIESQQYYIIENGVFTKLNESTVRPPSQWSLSNKFIEKLKSDGIDAINKILDIGNKSEFQIKLLDSLNLLSIATTSKNIVEKLVYIFAAIESMLLRNETEPIQQNLADRIAFAISSNGEQREKIVKNVKLAYTYRSKFLHHGFTIDETEELNDFLQNIWKLFFHLIQLAFRFQTKDDMIIALEKQKYGG